MPFSFRRSFCVLLLALAGLLAGCSRQTDFTSTPSQLPDRTLPFHAVSAKPGKVIGPSLADVTPGTLIVVRLKAPLSSSLARSGESFTAVLDGPVIVRGQTVAPKGAVVSGKVLEAKPSDPNREAGYLRLALTGITVERKIQPFQTSSIFVKGHTYDREAPAPPVQLVGASSSRVSSLPVRPLRVVVHEDVAVPADRSLTFRLSQPSLNTAVNDHP